MWICSQLGFYSIVQKDGAWHVRARSLHDLNNLVRAAGLKVQVQRWPAADYRFRVLIQAESLGKVFSALEKSINYPNFKSRVAELPQQRAKVEAYTRLWGDMYGIQEGLK